MVRIPSGEVVVLLSEVLDVCLVGFHLEVVQRVLLSPPWRGWVEQILCCSKGPDPRGRLGVEAMAS